jgi:hypothetical protein
MIKKIKRKISKLLSLWSEFWLLPLAIGIWVVSPYVIHSIDETSGVFDAAFLQGYFGSIIGTILFNCTAFLLMYLNFRKLFSYYAGKKETEVAELQPQIVQDFKHLSPWERLKLLFLVYFGLLAVTALLALTLLG